MIENTSTEYFNASLTTHLTLTQSQSHSNSMFTDHIEEMPFWTVRDNFGFHGSKAKGILVISENYSLTEVTSVVETEGDYANKTLFQALLDEGIITMIGNFNSYFGDYPDRLDFTNIDPTERYNVILYSLIYMIQKKSMCF